MDRGEAAARTPSGARQRRPLPQAAGPAAAEEIRPEATADADGDSIMGSPPNRDPAEGVRPRRYCPVQGCPESSSTRAQGWTDPAALRKHMECHASGRITGNVPRDWMSENGLEQCSVCSRLLSTRYGGACPRCRASLGVGATGPARGAREVPPDWPNIKIVFT